MESEKQKVQDKIKKYDSLIESYYQLIERHVELGDPDEAASWTKSTTDVIAQIKEKRDLLATEANS